MVTDKLLIQPPYQVANEGDTTSIHCLSNEPPNWKHNDEIIYSNNVMLVYNTIVFYNMTIDMAGDYECQGINEYGMVFWSVSVLHVNGK